MGNPFFPAKVLEFLLHFFPDKVSMVAFLEFLTCFKKRLREYQTTERRSPRHGAQPDKSPQPEDS